ncbi:MAG: DUF1492 domain-containing protein [Acidaminococcaceae bacterium]|nr:DUF1492 domain-containing protein [Acidaminococcaceae bacterium]
MNKRKPASVEEMQLRLNKYQTLKDRIQNNLDEVERLRNCMVRVTVAYKDAPGWDRKQSDQNVILTEIEKLSKHIKADTDNLSKAFYEAERLIGELDNVNEAQVLRYKYIYGYSWEEIEEKMKYSRATLWRFHRKALYHLVSKFETIC